MCVDGFYHSGVCNEETVDEKAEAGSNERDFFVTEEADDGFVVGNKIGVEAQDSGVGVVDDLLEEIRCRFG